MKEEEEQATKDRFVNYLRLNEGGNYLTVGRHVLARNQSRRFDWLLSSPRGTLALEITTRSPEAEELGNDSKTALVWNELERLIQPSTLDGAFCVRTPSIYPFTTAKLKSILRMYGPDVARAIKEASSTLGVDQKEDVNSKLGVFNIRRLPGGPALYFTGAREGYPGSTHAAFNDIFMFLDKTIEHKNDQLDTDADRRVLLISNDGHFGNSFLLEASAEFFGAPRDDMRNIDEVFIEFDENVFEKAYESREKRN